MEKDPLKINACDIFSVETWNDLVGEFRDLEQYVHRVHISDDGKVGIGENFPKAKLHIEAGGTTNVGLIVNGRIRSFGSGGMWVTEEAKDNQGGMFVGASGSDKIGFWNNGNWGLTLDDDGKVGIRGSLNVGGTTSFNDSVGIGTTTPKGKLTVKGDLYVTDGWLRTTGKNGVYFQDYGGGFHMTDDDWIRTYNNKNFYHNTGVMRTDGTFQVGPSGERLLVDGNGNLKIKGDLLMQGFKKIQIGAFSIVDADGKIDITYNDVTIFRVDKLGNMSTKGSHDSGRIKP